MEPLSDIMAAQKMLLQKRANLEGPRKYKKRKKPKQLPLKIFKGFTQIPHFMIDSMLSDKTLTKREQKVLLFIIRLTIGLHKTSIDLLKIDFESVGVLPGHITKILKSLSDKQWVIITETPKVIYYGLHKIRFAKNLAVSNRKLNDLIHNKLIKYRII